MTTGLVWDERFMWHDTGSAAAFLPAGGMLEPDTHVENPATKRRLRNLLEVSGLLDHLDSVTARPATEQELTRFHAPDYVARIRRQSAEEGGDAGELTPFGPGSHEIALLAAGGTIAATDAVVDGHVDNAYALVRPPGHHAEADRGRGFCIYGNVALAVLHARAARGVERAAVVDWDVHHGNGTEQAFWRDPAVLTVSLHQDRWYPRETGAVEAVGEGAGEGSNLNVPLPPGSGVGAYQAAFRQVVVPALRAHRPDVIFVASGFDGSALDPMGRMMVHSGCYRELTRILLDEAAGLCEGRLVLSHEGGYSSAYVPFCGLAVMEELSGAPTDVEDPFLRVFDGLGGQALQPHQQAAIDRAEANLEVGLRTAREPFPGSSA